MEASDNLNEGTAPALPDTPPSYAPSGALGIKSWAEEDRPR